MSSNKTITINPEMFKINVKSKKKTTQKKNLTGSEIKFKKPKTVKYNKLLGLIRQKQKTNYDKLLNEKTDESTTPIEVYPKGEFEESLNFLNELRKNNENQELKPLANFTEVVNNSQEFPNLLPSTHFSHQHTIKNHYPHHENVNIEFPSNIPTFDPSTVITQDINFKLSPPPSYGVLKNGKLPTYRQYIKTLSNRNQILPSLSLQEIPSENSDFKENETFNRANMVIKQKESKINKPCLKLHYPKRKKTIRRTFYIGRSKHYSKIGVLINNKTIRDECSTKKHLLKQTPIGEVKKFLIKKGLIKTGSSAPNDVLRKMYESANMICGDIQNHNTDILLHNYFNEGKI